MNRAIIWCLVSIWAVSMTACNGEAPADGETEAKAGEAQSTNNGGEAERGEESQYPEPEPVETPEEASTGDRDRPEPVINQELADRLMQQHPELQELARSVGDQSALNAQLGNAARRLQLGEAVLEQGLDRAAAQLGVAEDQLESGANTLAQELAAGQQNLDLFAREIAAQYAGGADGIAALAQAYGSEEGQAALQGLGQQADRLGQELAQLDGLEDQLNSLAARIEVQARALEAALGEDGAVGQNFAQIEQQVSSATDQINQLMQQYGPNAGQLLEQLTAHRAAQGVELGLACNQLATCCSEYTEAMGTSGLAHVVPSMATACQALSGVAVETSCAQFRGQVVTLLTTNGQALSEACR